MNNIMKSQVYQLRKDKITKIAFFMVLFIQITNPILNNISSTLEKTACIYIVENIQTLTMMPLLFLAILVGTICTADFTDKTLNYEIMTGHTRLELFLGRVIPCIVLGTVMSLIFMALPVVITSVILGWGTEISIGDMVFRLVLFLFPVIRIICELIFVAFLVKNPYIVMGAGYFAVMLVGVLVTKKSCMLGMTNINLLSNFNLYSVFNLNGKKFIVYDLSLGIDNILGTIFLSLFFGAVFLFLAYHFFKTDDLN